MDERLDYGLAEVEITRCPTCNVIVAIQDPEKAAKLANHNLWKHPSPAMREAAAQAMHETYERYRTAYTTGDWLALSLMVDEMAEAVMLVGAQARLVL